MNHWAIPREIWKTMEEEKEAKEQGRLTKKQQQQQLGFKTVVGPRDFTREAALHAVTKLIATNNQVSHVVPLKELTTYALRTYSHSLWLITLPFATRWSR